MDINDLRFIPHSDMGINDADIVNQHSILIKNKKFDDASSLLDSNYKKGFVASLFNHIQNKIREIQLYLMNKVIAEPDEIYSDSEPTEEEMEGKKFWIKPY